MTVIAQHLPPPQESLTMLLGIAAVLMVIGWTLTRLHRDRQRFALMRAALEKGVTQFPGTPPFWLVSLRQGITLVTVGFGLIVIGGGAWWMVRGTPMPTTASALSRAEGGELSGRSALISPATTAPGDASVVRPLPPPGAGLDGGVGPEDDRRPGPPPRLRDGQRPPPQGDGPPDREDRHRPNDPSARGPRGDRDGMEGPMGPRRLPRDPEMERWHWAQAQHTVGLVSGGVGLVLMLLGIVRIGFARIEQRYVSDSDPTHSP